MDSPQKKRVSQAQIAEQVGCSQALVSMALNGRTKGISKKTYNRIREIAYQNGYTPRGMKMEESDSELRSKTVGYILRAPLKLANKSNFFSHVHQGLHEMLAEQRIKTVYIGSEDDFSNPEHPLASQIPDSVRGIAIMGEVDPVFHAEVRRLGRPLVYIAARATGLCHSVLSNEAESGALLVEYLYDAGHRTYAWIGGDKHSTRHADRKGSVEAALQARGLALDPQFSASMDHGDRNDGYEAAEQLFNSVSDKADLPTAWVAHNALMARGAINFLHQKGIQVGSEISITAFDMTRVCTEERPSITSAGADPESMGREAARILMQAIEKESESLSDLTLPAKLVVRDTTGPAVSRSGSSKP